VAHSCHPSFLGGRDQENHGLRPTWANNSWDPISKITRAKGTGGVAQVLRKHKVQSSKPVLLKKTQSLHLEKLKDKEQKDWNNKYCSTKTVEKKKKENFRSYFLKKLTNWHTFHHLTKKMSKTELLKSGMKWGYCCQLLKN
jgi:hypothetical protein